MKKLWLILAISGLVLTILPSLLVFNEVIQMEESHQVMAVGLLLWFTGRFFYGKKK